jgi:hypothetical protein
MYSHLLGKYEKEEERTGGTYDRKGRKKRKDTGEN